jgi:hypothetical protein
MREPSEQVWEGWALEDLDAFLRGEDDGAVDPPDLDDSDAICTCGDPDCSRPFGHEVSQ